MTQLKGVGVSSGISHGEIRLYCRSKNKIVVKSISDTASELRRWRDAVGTAVRQLSKLCESRDSDTAQLFSSHRLMLQDPYFVAAVESRILNDRVNAEAAVDMASSYFARQIASSGDQYMQERIADIDDVSTRLTNILLGAAGVSGSAGAENRQEESEEQGAVIIAAEDLSPSETIALGKSGAVGFILTYGSQNCHAAILARSLGLPVIVGVEGIDKKLEGRSAVMDGEEGTAVVDPDEETRKSFFRKHKKEELQRREYESLKGKSDVTADGKRIKVYANIVDVSGVSTVLENDAAGIGLFRSEFLYLTSSRLPTEEQQFRAYSQVLESMHGKSVIIRTLDAGADKSIEYFGFGLKKEENPALGLRGIRLCLSRPEMFKTQLRALYRASVYGDLSIMFPMISSMWEVMDAKSLCDEVKDELAANGIPFNSDMPIGIMIETPAAVMIAGELAKEADFFSIGTNDLAQYTLAADRQGSDETRYFYNTSHPAVMRMIEIAIKAAHDNGIWAGICGEAAADPALTQKFIKMGADEFSVSPRFVLPLRNAVRNSKAEEQ